MKEDETWQSFGITGDFLTERAAWLREPRSLHGRSLRFFELAGTLVEFSRFSYPLASVAFFQAIPGLEKALKMHYSDEEGKLAELMQRALADKLLTDATFSDIRPFTEPFSEKVDREIGTDRRPYSERLAQLIPKLRNQYLHGIYLLAPDYLHLTFQLREIADATKWAGKPVA